MALATDCNPGSSPLTSLLLAMNMGATLFRMTVAECLAGVTREGARALGVLGETGTLEAGKWCDLAIWQISPACRARLPDRLQPIAQPGVEGAMSGRDASLVVSPGRVRLDDLAQVLAGAAVVLDPSFWPRVEAASAIVAQAAGAEAPVYGINTGFGKLASRRIPPDETALLQRNSIVSHCCGVGSATPNQLFA